MASAGFHAKPFLCFESLIASCAPSRQLRLTARSFQLRSRPSQSCTFHSESSHQKTALPSARTNHTISNQDASKQHPKVNQAPASKSEDTSTLAETLRHDMRQIAHPVAVITSTDTKSNPEGGPTSWRGATVSSFVTTAMKPTPIVSFNIHEKSTTLEAIQNSKHFAVHLLAQTPEARDIAERFSRGNNPSPFYGKDSSDVRAFVHTNNWTDVKDLQPYLPPNLQWTRRDRTDAILTTVLCETQEEDFVSVGDHTVVFGRVVEILKSEDPSHGTKDIKTSQPEGCLIYRNGAYNVEGESMLDLPSA